MPSCAIPFSHTPIFAPPLVGATFRALPESNAVVSNNVSKQQRKDLLYCVRLRDGENC